LCLITKAFITVFLLTVRLLLASSHDTAKGIRTENYLHLLEKRDV
jgi:hypothetical protein